MDKIKITKEQFIRLLGIRAAFPVREGSRVQETVAENISEANRLCKGLGYDLMDLQDLLYDTEEAFYSSDTESALSTMAEYASIARGIVEYAQMIEDYLAGAIEKFSEITEPSTLVITAKNEEIQETIDRNFEICPVMSIGFMDGSFALLFGEDEDRIDIEPFIFAKGQAEDYDEAMRFIEGFLDLEQME